MAPPIGGGGGALSLDDGLLWLLPGRRLHAAENTWPAVLGRLEGDESARAKALWAWWAQTEARHVDAALHGHPRDFGAQGIQPWLGRAPVRVGRARWR